MGEADRIKAEMLGLMQGFIERKLDVSVFVVEYQRLWRAWRDLNYFAGLDLESANAFDRAFTAADCYSPPRNPPLLAAIDEDQLRSEIEELYKILKNIP